MNLNDQKIAGERIAQHLDAIKEMMGNSPVRSDDNEGREMRYAMAERLGCIRHWAERLIQEARE